MGRLFSCFDLPLELLLAQAIPTVAARYYCVPLIRELEGYGDGISFDIDDKVSAKDFRIEKSGEHVGEKVGARPELVFPKGTGSALKPD